MPIQIQDALGAKTNATSPQLAEVKTALAIDQVDNTTDTNKPVSTLQAQAIASAAAAAAQALATQTSAQGAVNTAVQVQITGLSSSGAQAIVNAPVVNGVIDVLSVGNSADVTASTKFSFSAVPAAGTIFAMLLKTAAGLTHSFPSATDDFFKTTVTAAHFSLAGEYSIFWRVNATGGLSVVGLPAYLPGAELMIQDEIDVEQQRLDNLKYPSIWFDASLATDPGDYDATTNPTAGTDVNPYKDFTVARGCRPGFIAKVKRSTTIMTGVPGATSTALTIPPTGTKYAPIIIEAYGEGTRPLVEAAGCNRGIRLSNDAMYVTLRGIRTGNCSAGANRLGISNSVTNPDIAETINHSIRLEDCEVFNIEDDGSTDCNGMKLYGGGNTISRPVVHDIGADGIWFHGYRTMIHRPKVYKVAMSGRVAGDCIQAGNKSDDTIIQGFDLDHRSHDGKQCIYFEAEAGSGRTSARVIIRDGTAKGYGGISSNHTAIYAQGPDAKVTRVIATGGQSAVSLGLRGQLTFSFIDATHGNGVQVSNDCQVNHSTITQSGTQQLQTTSCGIRAGTNTSSGNTARNNIIGGFYHSIYAVTSIVDGQPTIAEDHNAIITRGGTPAHKRVDSVVVAPHASDFLAGYVDVLTMQTALGVDANYRPKVGSLLGPLATPVPLWAPQDKDFRGVDAFPVGAWIGELA